MNSFDSFLAALAIWRLTGGSLAADGWLTGGSLAAHWRLTGGALAAHWRRTGGALAAGSVLGLAWADRVRTLSEAETPHQTSAVRFCVCRLDEG